ncbi:BatD family protein [Urbifossiella limnaea]|uniref:Protein BatD n=1 Tax=Urbifossiella limnaea TaxID=2528023 RepID=A0A517XMD8_9BACT|nr:BatD family protein [Urbifossiella limnaea]QDU18670.1 hypothetical protein ETAA1_05630 [Urbifossiella limnaea]
MLRPAITRATFVVLVFLIPHPSSLIPARQPSFFEPKEGYYGARGTAVKARWDVTPTTVPEGGAVVATLTVTGATNPAEVKRPDLAKVADFTDRFVVEDVPGPVAAKGLAFAYRLRPRTRGVTDVPGLNFFYFNADAAPERRYQNARALGVKITVTAAPPTAAPPAVPLDAPDRMFVVETGARLLDDEPFAPGPAAWAALAALAVLTPVGWYAAWRAAYPDAARLARRRRSRAARRALAAVRAAGRSADPAAACAAAVIGYLRARYPLPPGADTPPEAAAALAALGVAGADAVEAFLRACDAARFAPTPDTAVSLAAAAEALVARLEAAE